MEIAAHHESGHIVMAYLSRFTCDEVGILPNGDGYSRFNYGNGAMLELVTALTNYNEHPFLFHSLSPNLQSAASQVSIKICGTLIGGPVGEALFRVGIEFNGDLEIEIAGPDLMRVASIDRLLMSIDTNHDVNYVNSQLRDIVGIFKQQQVWSAVENLASKIIQSSDHRLVRTEIEASLNESGYIAFIA